MSSIRCIPTATTPIDLQDFSYSVFHSSGGLERFKHDINEYLGSTQSQTSTSFMRAIYLCLKILCKNDARKGIIIPRFSCPTFAHAILAAGLDIQYCDTDPATLSIDINSLNQMNFETILAIIVVNHQGLANPMDELVKLAKKHNVFLIEDIGYSFGTEYKNKKLGSIGDFAVLNFKEGKSIPIGGGMITVNGEKSNFEKAEPKLKKSNIGRLLAYKYIINPYFYSLFKKSMNFMHINGKRMFTSEDTIRNSTNEYDYEFNYDMPLYEISDFQGAMGSTILSKINKYIQIRRKNAEYLESELKNCKNITLIKKESGVNLVHYIRYCILVQNNKRDLLLKELEKGGIEASAIYPEVRPDPEKFPGAFVVSDQILTLPCHPGINDRDLNKIVHIIRTFA